MKQLLLVLAFAFIIPNLDWRIYLDMFPNIRELAQAESNINSKALNPKDTDGLPAKGLLQFKDKTFYGWAKLAGLKNPSIWNPMHQIIVARWAEENGLLWHWGPFKKLVKQGKIIIDL